jgi:hypothetical protein
MILHTQNVSATGRYDDAALGVLSGLSTGTTIACFHVEVAGFSSRMCLLVLVELEVPMVGDFSSLTL